MSKVSVKQKMIGLGLCFVVIISGCEAKKTDYQRPVELRGVYLNMGDKNIFATPRSVAEAMHFLGEHHFNAVFPLFQIDDGMIHKTEFMDGFIGKPADSIAVNRNPLAELIYEAHRQGLKVIPLC